MLFLGTKRHKPDPTTHPNKYINLPISVIPPLRICHNINEPVKIRENKIKNKTAKRKNTMYLCKNLSTADIKRDKDF